jgi:ferredoxin
MPTTVDQAKCQGLPCGRCITPANPWFSWDASTGKATCSHQPHANDLPQVQTIAGLCPVGAIAVTIESTGPTDETDRIPPTPSDL